MRVRPLVLLLLALGAHSALAVCDAIPGAQGSFRGALGAIDRPFARPGDPVELRLDPTCHGTSAGLDAIASNHVVTILFQPPAGVPTAVVLAPDCLGFATARDRCEVQLGGGIATCVSAGDAVSAVERDGVRRLVVRFPDTDALVVTPGDPSSAADGRTLTGPATIAVTRTGDDLPCGLAAGAHCRDTLGLVACVDELYVDDGACDDVPHRVFGHFTALPPANDFGALCTDPDPPCTGQAQEVRLTVDGAGNLLVPMDWRRVLVRRAEVPVPRLLRAAVTLEAFEGSGVPVRLPDESPLGSFSLRGTQLPPLFTPQREPDSDALALFGTADAPEGVLRIARTRACAGGDLAGRPCDRDAQCPGGACGNGLFDFATRLLGGSGPIVLRRNACLGGSRPLGACTSASECPGGQCVTLQAEARDPVPLDGLRAADAGYAFVVNETLVGDDRNGDGDSTDDVVQLADEQTGLLLPIGDGSAGRAVVRLRRPPFSSPAVAAAGDLVAFLEPEALQGNRDASGDGDRADTVLRVFRLGGATAVDVTGGMLTADAAPVIDGEPLALSAGRVFFRTSEAAQARRTTTVVSLRQSGEPDGDANLLRSSQAVSADGRIVTFATGDEFVVPGDVHCEPSGLCRDVFAIDRDADGDGRFDPPGAIAVTRVSAAEALAPATVSAVSADGSTVAFISPAATLVAGDTNWAPDAFVWDRATGVVSRVSLGPGGAQSVGGVIDAPYALAISADGQVVAFASFAPDLVPGDGNGVADVFVHDRRNGVTERASVATGGLEGDGGSFLPGFSALGLSADARLVAFDSDATNLVPGDQNGAADVFVRDRLAGSTTRASVGVLGEEANAAARAPAIAPDGSAVGFTSVATNLVPGVTRGLAEVYVHDLAARVTEVASVASDGAPADSSSSEIAFSADGRFIAFASRAATLVPDDRNAMQDVFVRDRATGLTERVSLTFDGREVPRPPVGIAEAVTPSLTADGRTAVFVHTEDLAEGIMRQRAVFVRQPDPADAAADLSGDGLLDDTVLQVLEPGAAPRTVCPAEQVAVAEGAAAFLRPEQAGAATGCPAGPDLNGDGDARDLVVHLAPRTGPVANLGLAARAVAMSPAWVAALVSEQDQGGVDRNGDGDADDLVAAVHPAAGPGAGWANLGQAATRVVVRGDRVILATPEGAQGVDLNGDGDRSDTVIQIGRAGTASATNLRFAVEDFVASDTLVAFRVREGAQGGRDLNGDGDAADDVLFVFDLRDDGLLETGQAVTPCRLEACDPRLPYRPLVDTVRFLTLEEAQGADLTGDGDRDDLVLQTFAVTAAPATATARTLRAAGENGRPGALATLAAVAAGRCASSGVACGNDEACGMDDRCIVPPGRCVADLGTPCRPGDADDCGPDQFCGSDPPAPDRTTCRRRSGECTAVADCAGGETCVGDGQQLQRLAAPLSDDRRAASALPAVGRCVDVATGQAGGPCRRDAECPGTAACRADLVTAGLADRDGDELPDAVDVCPDVADPAQRDTDRDGIGDACDRRTAGNGVREAGEDCDGADDAACPGQCQPDAQCRCQNSAPGRIRVRASRRRNLAVRATLPLGDYDGGEIRVRLDDGAGRAIVAGGVAGVPALVPGVSWSAAGKGSGLTRVQVKRLRTPGMYRVRLTGERWLPAGAPLWARVTLTAGGRCFATERRRIPPVPPTTVPTTTTSTTTSTTATSTTTTTTTLPAGDCCGPHRMVLETTTGGRFQLGASPAVDLPAGTRIVLDVGPPDAQCRHAVTIPPGGFEMPPFCVGFLPWTADVIARGCTGGDALGRGTAWDGNALAPDPDIRVVGDTRDGICNPPGEACVRQELEAGGNQFGADVSSVGDGVPNPRGVHLAVELPVVQALWDPREPDGGAEVCLDPDGRKNFGEGVSEIFTMLRLTTGTATASFIDRNADGCSQAGASGPSATVFGAPASGPCCQVGQRLTLAAAGAEYTGRDFLGDVVATASIPAVVTACEASPGLSTCEAVRGGGRVVSAQSSHGDDAHGVVSAGGGTVVGVGRVQALDRSISPPRVRGGVGAVRLLPDGRIDTSFGTEGTGRVRIAPDGDVAEVGGAARDGDGRIVAVGVLDIDGASDMLLLRLSPGGAVESGLRAIGHRAHADLRPQPGPRRRPAAGRAHRGGGRRDGGPERLRGGPPSPGRWPRSDLRRRRRRDDGLRRAGGFRARGGGDARRPHRRRRRRPSVERPRRLRPRPLPPRRLARPDLRHVRPRRHHDRPRSRPRSRHRPARRRRHPGGRRIAPRPLRGERGRRRPVPSRRLARSSIRRRRHRAAPHGRRRQLGERPAPPSRRPPSLRRRPHRARGPRHRRRADRAVLEVDRRPPRHRDRRPRPDLRHGRGHRDGLRRVRGPRLRARASARRPTGRRGRVRPERQQRLRARFRVRPLPAGRPHRQQLRRRVRVGGGAVRAAPAVTVAGALLPGHAAALHLEQEATIGEPELARRVGLVAAARRQRPIHTLALELAHRRGERARGNGPGRDGGGQPLEEVLRGYLLVRRTEQQRALDQVLELSDVALVVVGLEGRRGFGAEPRARLAELARDASQEVLGQQRDVLGPLHQRRHADGKHAQPVVQVLAEPACPDLGVEVPVGGGDHAHVDVEGPGRADRHDLPLLQDPQQVHLQRRARFADLVEEDRAAVGDLEQPFLVGGGARERAALVAEERARQQALGQRPDVHRHEEPPRPRALLVDGAGHQLLSRAGAALEQHGGGRRRDHPRLLDHTADGGALAHDGAEASAVRRPAPQEHVLGRQPLVGRRQLADQALVLRGEPGRATPQLEGFDGAADDAAQLRRVERLRNVPQDASQVDRAHQRLDVGVAGQDDRDDVGTDLARPGDHLQTRHAGHALISHQHADVVAPQELDRPLATGGGVDVELLAEVQLADVEDVRLVIDEQHGTGTMVDRVGHGEREPRSSQVRQAGVKNARCVPAPGAAAAARR